MIFSGTTTCWAFVRRNQRVLAVAGVNTGSGMRINAAWEGAYAKGPDLRSAGALSPGMISALESRSPGVLECDVLEVTTRELKRRLSRRGSKGTEGDDPKEQRLEMQGILKNYAALRKQLTRQLRQELAPVINAVKGREAWTHISSPREARNNLLKPIHMRKTDKTRRAPEFVRTQIEADVFYPDSMVSHAISTLRATQNQKKGDALARSVIGAAARRSAASGEAAFWETAGLPYPHVTLRAVADLNLFLRLAPADHNNAILAMHDEDGCDFIALKDGGLEFHRWTPVTPTQSPAQYEAQLVSTLNLSHAGNEARVFALPYVRKADQPAALSTITQRSYWSPLDHSSITYANKNVEACVKKDLRAGISALGLLATGLPKSKR